MYTQRPLAFTLRRVEGSVLKRPTHPILGRESCISGIYFAIFLDYSKKKKKIGAISSNEQLFLTLTSVEPC